MILNVVENNWWCGFFGNVGFGIQSEDISAALCISVGKACSCCFCLESS
jgi:hypothetical protein